MRALSNILVVLIAIAILYGMWRTKPRYGELTGPIRVYGKMHDVVHTREFDVKLDQVIFARELTFTQYGKTKVLTTSGLWAIVNGQLAATTSTTNVSAAKWVGPTGLKYAVTNRVSGPASLPPYDLAPGLPKQARFVFELTPDQVNGATFVLSSKPEPALDSEAHITLDDFKKFNDGQPLIMDRFDPLSPVSGS